MIENLRVADLAKQVNKTPFYVMSKTQLHKNFEAYKKALVGLESAFIGFSVKANHNLNVLRYLAEKGCGAVLVSGNEILTALKAGFDPQKMIYNGNGKTIDELRIAIQKRILVNIDSEFDLQNIIYASKTVGLQARTLLRINPDVDPEVHPYVSTGLANSKFGIQNQLLSKYLQKIRENDDHIKLLGVHCHIGSTIKDVNIFRDTAEIMIQVVQNIRQEGFHLEYLNIGGGLGIDYERSPQCHKTMPTPQNLIDSIRDLVLQSRLKLIIEPGRSLIGNTCLFVNKVIGVKSNGQKNFIVVDGSMSELIRPSLYNTYHHIELAQPCDGQIKRYDVVGPVCESADFLGKDRNINTPKADDILVVYDAGAYCHSMSSMYNMKLTCAEYMVEGNNITMIRKPLSLDDYLQSFECSEPIQNSQLKIEHQQQEEQQSVRDSLKLKQKTKSIVKKSTLDFRDSFTIDQIDEDEDEQFLSPERMVTQSSKDVINRQDYLGGYNSQEIKLRNLSGSGHWKQNNHSRGESERSKYSYFMSSSNKSKNMNNESSEEPSLSGNRSNSDSLDSDEDDLAFMKAQEKLEQQRMECEQLDSNTSPSFKLPSKFRIQTGKTDSQNQNQQNNDKTMNPQKSGQRSFQMNLNKPILNFQEPSSQNIGEQRINREESFKLQNLEDQQYDSPIISGKIRKPEMKFATQKKQFQIKAIHYDGATGDDFQEQFASLRNEEGGEIDIKQLTSQKKKKRYAFNDENEDGEPTVQVEEVPSFSVDRMKFLGLTQKSFCQTKVQGKDMPLISPPQPKARMQLNLSEKNLDVAPGPSGLGSAGVRFKEADTGTRLINSQAKPQSSVSSKREAFRNRLKQTGSLASLNAFNRFRLSGAADPGDDTSNASNRFRVIKLDKGVADQDALSQEQMFKNQFEKVYDEFETIGEGCSSVVKRCEHKVLKQLRAVKKVRSDDEEYLEIAKREFYLLKSLNHNGVVKMFDQMHDESSGTLYLIMELIEGVTLEDFVLEQQAQSSGEFHKEEFVQKTIQQLLVIVEYLHQNGVCHRDIKPDNILIHKKNKQIKLTDFNASRRFMEKEQKEEDSKLQAQTKQNLARKQTSSIANVEISLANKIQTELNKNDTNSHGSSHKKQLASNQKISLAKKHTNGRIPMRTVTGLDQWSAPETRQGGEYFEGVDLWGIGCIMYYIIARKPPFIDYDERRLFKKVQECNYEPLSDEHLKFYSEDCMTFLKSLLVADPEQRMKLSEAFASPWMQKQWPEERPKEFGIESYISPRKERMRQERPSITLNPIQMSNKDSPKRKNDSDEMENEFKRPTRHMTDHNIQLGQQMLDFKDDKICKASKMPERKLIIGEEQIPVRDTSEGNKHKLTLNLSAIKQQEQHDGLDSPSTKKLRDRAIARDKNKKENHFAQDVKIKSMVNLLQNLQAEDSQLQVKKERGNSIQKLQKQKYRERIMTESFNLNFMPHPSNTPPTNNIQNKQKQESSMFGSLTMIKNDSLKSNNSDENVLQKSNSKKVPTNFQSNIIKVQRVQKKGPGGYSSDEEEDSELGNELFRNKNDKYIKEKQYMKQRKLTFDDGEGRPKKIDDKGYDEDSESGGNPSQSGDQQTVVQMKSPTKSRSPLKQRKNKSQKKFKNEQQKGQRSPNSPRKAHKMKQARHSNIITHQQSNNFQDEQNI